MRHPLQVFLLLGVCVHVAAQKLLHVLARPSLGDSGELLDSGTDLSNSFVAE